MTEPTESDAVAFARMTFLEDEARARKEARQRLDRDERGEFEREIAYWEGMYRVLLEIIAEQKPDPAYEWLDELTRRGAVKRKFGT